MLRVRDLKARQGDFLLSIDELQVDRGGLTAVVGPSGSGKSTLLLALGGFLPGTQGRIEVEGASVEVLPPERRHIAVVFQRGALFPHMTVWQNLEFPLRIQGTALSQRSAQIEQWLKRVELTGLEKRLPHQLSGGQQQRVALARALLTRFPVLLFDEPFSALDTTLKAELRQLVRETTREAGVACLLVTHDMADVDALADHVLLLRGGQVEWQGTVGQFRARGETR